MRRPLLQHITISCAAVVLAAASACSSTDGGDAPVGTAEASTPVPAESAPVDDGTSASGSGAGAVSGSGTESGAGSGVAGSEPAIESAPASSGPAESAATDGEIVVTDMVGRDVTLPGPVSNAFGAGPPATTLLYTFGGEYLAGWNTELSDDLAAYVDESLHEIPVLGRAFGGGGTFNPEVLLDADVDLIVDAGELNESYIDSANDLQEQTGIPVIQLSTDPDKLAEAYRILGTVFGDPERATELADETERIVEEVAEGAATIADADQVSVYYAQGAEGLGTAPAGSIHTRVIELIGATNAAGDELESESGRIDVDFEQVLVWKPDWVVLAPDSDSDQLAQDPTEDENFGTLDAIKQGHYLTTPNLPYNWFDQPPSVNQLLGMMWAAESIYPDAYDFDLVSEAQSFYRTYYHYDLSAADAEQMIKASGSGQS